MIGAVKVNLISVPEYNEKIPVSTYSDGSVESYIFDLRWSFSGSIRTGVGKSISVAFTRIDIRYRKYIQSTLAYVIDKYKQINKTHPTIGQIEHWKSGLNFIAQSLEDCNWGLLSDDKNFNQFIKSYREIVIKRELSQSSVNRVVTTINLLNKCKFCCRDVTIDNLSVKSARIVKQHIAIPANIYQRILSDAISTIETLHPYRHEISRLMNQVQSIYDEERNRADGSSSRGKINDRTASRVQKIHHGIPNFTLTRDGTNITRILTPCAIVLLAFSGVRVGELTSFTKDSYEERKGENGSIISFLKGETTKTVNGIPKKEVWQTHPISKDALELAYDCTEYLRTIFIDEVNKKHFKNETNSDEYKRAQRALESAFLPVTIEGVNKTNYKSVVAGSKSLKSHTQRLNIMATKEDVESFNTLNPSRQGELLEAKSLPKISAHDFRRTFAVFFKRYGFGTTATIKFQYKHKNINMSDYYGKNAQLQHMEDILLDTDLIQLLHEEGVNLGIDIFNEIYNESETLSGSGGERIARDKFEKLRTGERIYMTKNEIASLVRNGTLSVVQLPTGGYCMNSKCSRVCGIGEFSAEIKPCEHQVITDKEANRIQQQNMRLIKTFRDLNTGDPMMNSILIGIKQKIKRNESLIIKHRIKLSTFEDNVKGTVVTTRG
ncbi:hypothetical protein CWC29_020320 [Pseudoalteromonas sp. S4498]|uniref:hypothetical protein n=1 Tax=Pseudoalteromonas galatheae TaxID=579562 RepID=UPI001109083A|nr:hypothetical protein [Pseudoalteromonas galatheae]NKC21132.1 hypothetical protein [Pseudoalteromonas galatheae]